jgi:glycosyltransferase involved in cell wall biosynthesis
MIAPGGPRPSATISPASGSAVCPAPTRSLRIALVTETFPPEINGVAMTLHRLVTALSRRHQVTVWRPRQPLDRAAAGGIACQIPGVAQHLRPGFPMMNWGFRFGLPSVFSLKRAWRRERPDVVHIATEGPLGWSALRTAERMGIPITSSFHTNFHDYSRYYGIGSCHGMVSRYLRDFHNRTMRTLVPSRDLLRDLEQDGYRNLTMFGRGVDTSLFSPGRRDGALRRQWGLDANGLAMIHVGRVAPEKNMPLAFAAFQRIRQQRPDARLVVVGEGPLRPEYMRQYPEAIFVGAKIGPELASHYASADLALFPSMSETFGNVVIEAMASGVPPVTYDYAAGQRYVRHAHSGWLVAFGDDQAFLDTAAGAAASVRTLKAFGANAREAALDIPWDAVFAQFESALAQAVDDHGRGMRPQDATPAAAAATANGVVNREGRAITT